MSEFGSTSPSLRARLLASFTTRLSDIFSYCFVFIASITGCAWVHRLTWDDLRYPWRVVDSDLSSVYSLAQAIEQSWTGLVHHSLGAPFTADLSLAFIPDDLHIEIIRVLVHLTNNPFTAVNLFYVLTFGLCAISFLFLADTVHIPRWASIPISLAYSWLPYHFTRMDAGHVFLAAYYMIPVGIVILLRLFNYVTSQNDDFFPSSKLRTTMLLIVVVAVGSSGAYYAVFFSLLAFTLVVLIPKKTGLKLQLKQFLTVSLVGITFLLAPLFRTVWGRRHGLHTVLTRSPEESVQFGGSLSRLLVPWGVWLPEKMKPLVRPMEYEWNAVPLLGVLGVWLILFAIVRRISNHNSDTDQTKSAISFFFTGALLFYLASGLSLIFAYTVDSSFRTWNRLSIVILTIALLMTGHMLVKIVRYRITASVALLIMVIVTQLAPLKNSGIGEEPDLVSIAAFKELQNVAAQIQTTVPQGCSILQLPIMAFPEGGQVDGVGNGEHLWLPLLTKGFRWSYGAPKGSDTGEYWIDVKFTSHESLIGKSLDLDFCAVIALKESASAFEKASQIKPLWRFPSPYKIALYSLDESN